MKIHSTSLALATLLLASAAVSQPVNSTAQRDPYVQMLIWKGMSEPDAVRRVGTLTEGMRVGQQIATDLPNRYAGLMIDDSPAGLRVVIKLTGSADVLLSRYTSNPDVVAGTARFSLAQLSGKQDRLAQSLRDSGESHVIGIDVASNRVSASLKRGGKAKGKLERESLLGDDVTIGEVDDPVSVLASVAGNKVEAMQRSTSTPTGGLWRDNASLGFAVTYGTSSRGYVTAAHFDECKPSAGIVLTACTKNQIATEPLSGASLSFVRQSFTTDYDVELRSTTSSAIAPTNTVRYGGGAFGYASYTITGAGTYAIGQPVCKQGFTTFYTCGTVQELAMLVSDANSGLYGRFVRIKPDAGTTLMANNGDSGGPVFAGGGLAMGLVTAGFFDTASPYYGHMVSMPIARLSGVSAAVLTVP